MLSKEMEGIIYEMYLQKNKKILGSGYEISKEALFQSDRSIVLGAPEEPEIFLTRNKARDPYDIVFSNTMLLNDLLAVRAKSNLERFLKEQDVNSFVFAIEDYLTEELEIINRLNLELDHVSVRMVNDDISHTLHVDGASPSRREMSSGQEVKITNFVIGEDEERFVDIFNRTFVGLCRPTTLDEVRSWTEMPEFDSDFYFFAEMNGEILGFLAIEVNLEKNTSYLQEIGVLEEARGKGVADKLMRHGFTSVLEKGVTKMGLGVREENHAGKRFFSKWQFRELYRRIFRGNAA